MNFIAFIQINIQFYFYFFYVIFYIKVKKQFKFKMNFFIHKSIKYLLILAINFTPMT